MELHEKLRERYLRAWGTRGSQLLESRIEAYSKQGLSREEAILRVAEDEGLIGAQPREFLCPKCGTLVSRGDKFCKNCGINFLDLPERLKEGPPPLETYKRRLSLTQRFYKLLIAPSEAMQDIALAPDYEGVFVVIAIQSVYLLVALGMVMQKIQISGPRAETIRSIFSSVFVAVAVLGIVVLLVKWVIKSLIVKHACDSGSGWDFKTAASVTGYAYITDVTMGIIGICLTWFLLPTLHLETTGLEAMRQAVDAYQVQVWSRFAFTLPFSFVGLLWKSYLGGLGTHLGTKEKCSLGTATIVFAVLSLVGLLFSFIT